MSICARVLCLYEKSVCGITRLGKRCAQEGNIRAVVTYAMANGPEGYYFGDTTIGECMRILYSVETEGQGKEKDCHGWNLTKKAVRPLKQHCLQ